jgi:release factor glutamine methyltransferase
MHTLKAALEEAMATIDRIDAQVLMAHVLGVNRAYLVANPMRVLTESEDAKVDMLVARRALGQPVAYLVENREFYSRDFSVGPEVLIPRPETETLVEAALSRLPAHHPGEARRAVKPETASRGPAILDLGTGSGAIAVTLACERADARITATDVSADALAVARRNAAAHACAQRIELLHGSWYEPVGERRFDMVVSNPPYIACGDAHLGQADLRFEPAHALTDGSADGLGALRAIVAGAAAHLHAGGWLLLEHGYDQAEAVARVLADAGFSERISLPDLAGIARVAGGKLD